jgi:hypothetical protein
MAQANMGRVTGKKIADAKLVRVTNLLHFLKFVKNPPVHRINMGVIIASSEIISTEIGGKGEEGSEKLKVRNQAP